MVVVINKTRKRIIDRNAKLCTTTLSKSLGLMFRFNIKNGLVMVFDKPIKISLHMWFVFRNIDIILLDENNRVIEMKRKFRPFSFFISKNRARYVIELPKNTIDKSRTKIKDIIIFE